MRRSSIARFLLRTFGGGSLALILAGSASAATVVIDNFTQPTLDQFYVISAINSDPYLHKTTAGGILGGQRDLLIDVQGTPGLTSAVGSIGNGRLDFGSSGPVTAYLQYDGIDADVPVPASLTNGGALGGDLTGGGTNDRFQLSFNSIDGGIIANPLSISIDLTGPAGSATFSGTLAESPAAATYTIPFTSFTPSGVFSFATVTSALFTLNTPPAATNVDFELTGILAVPEPGTMALCGMGALGLAILRRRYR